MNNYIKFKTINCDLELLKKDCRRINNRIIKQFKDEDIEHDSEFMYNVNLEFGASTGVAIISTILDVYEMVPPIPSFRKYDPELYDIIQDDMRMRAPPDTGLIWNFYSKVYLKI